MNESLLNGILLSCNRCGNTNHKVYHLPISFREEAEDRVERNLITKVVCNECGYVIKRYVIEIPKGKDDN